MTNTLKHNKPIRDIRNYSYRLGKVPVHGLFELAIPFCVKRNFIVVCLHLVQKQNH